MSLDCGRKLDYHAAKLQKGPDSPEGSNLKPPYREGTELTTVLPLNVNVNALVACVKPSASVKGAFTDPMSSLWERVWKFLEALHKMPSSSATIHWSSHGKHSMHLHEISWMLSPSSALCLVLRACFAPQMNYFPLVVTEWRQDWFLRGWCGPPMSHSHCPDSWCYCRRSRRRVTFSRTRQHDPMNLK